MSGCEASRKCIRYDKGEALRWTHARVPDWEISVSNPVLKEIDSPLTHRVPDASNHMNQMELDLIFLKHLSQWLSLPLVFELWYTWRQSLSYQFVIWFHTKDIFKQTLRLLQQFHPLFAIMWTQMRSVLQCHSPSIQSCKSCIYQKRLQPICLSRKIGGIWYKDRKKEIAFPKRKSLQKKKISIIPKYGHAMWCHDLLAFILKS